MKRTVIITAFGSFLVVTAMVEAIQKELKTEAQTANATAPVPSVDQILDKYIQAIGGRVAVEKLTTRVMTGSLVAPGGSAPIEIYEKAPNKFLVVINSPVSGLSQNGFNGAVAWSRNSQRGLREMSGPEVENFKREYHLHREIKLKEFYPEMTVKGREKISDQEAYVVKAVAAEGTSEAMYFDVSSGLLIRRDVTIRGTTLQTYFEDYKEVDGVKIPFTVRRSRADFSFSYKFDEVKHNVTIEDMKFNKPAT